MWRWEVVTINRRQNGNKVYVEEYDGEEDD